MATEETDGGEFQEKAGLKRKLTGPPRLLLGKPLSPVRDEIKSEAHVLRKQQRQKCSEPVKDTTVEHQDEAGCEPPCVSCLSPQTAVAGKEGATSCNLQEKPLEVMLNLEESRANRPHVKNKLKRTGAKSTFKRIFSPAIACVMRRNNSEEHPEDNTTHRAWVSLRDVPGDGNTTQESLTIPGVALSEIKKGNKEVFKKAGAGKKRRNFHVRIWPFFKRLSVTSARNLSQEEGCLRPCSDTFIETASGKSVEVERSFSADKPDRCASESSGAADEHLDGSSEIHEDTSRIPEEPCPGKDPDHKEESPEVLKLSVEVSADPNTAFLHEEAERLCCNKQDVCKHHQLPYTVDEMDTKVQMTEILEPIGLVQSDSPPPSVDDCSSDTEVAEMSSNVPVTHMTAVNETYKIVPIENEVKSKPVITIENVPSSDEENQEPLENNLPQCGRLSTVVSVNVSCYPLKINSMPKDTSQILDQSEHKSLLSEILLVQTGLSLVRDAISGAVEQLSAEVQNNQTDQRNT
ncbi:uncharacterized protein LOC143523246 [Brachyhypopomus gauderio]|uniref:uncharacterized protein LOC143523246 n=1 Tax=Brachyhypopomus gauderio TaxID=698409 RepID=UPI004041D28E